VAASVLARALPGTGTTITVIESPEIGTIGVGEATIPPIIDLLRFLSIDEGDFVRHTQATYKWGSSSAIGRSWGTRIGTRSAPSALQSIVAPFHHCWHQARASGLEPRLNDFSLCAALGDEGKFRFPDADPGSEAAGLRYALHFDATLVAKYLRAYAERLGVSASNAPS